MCANGATLCEGVSWADRLELVASVLVLSRTGWRSAAHGRPLLLVDRAPGDPRPPRLVHLGGRSCSLLTAGLQENNVPVK